MRLIVWQSARAVFTRLPDGVEPQVVDDIRHVAEHITDVCAVYDVRARWLGHQLLAELDVAIADDASVAQGDTIAGNLERELIGQLPALKSAPMQIRPSKTRSA